MEAKTEKSQEKSSDVLVQARLRSHETGLGPTVRGNIVKTLFKLGKRENARWLALLIDAEGSEGWRRYARGRNRTGKRWRYWYEYRTPYISVQMLELESKEIIDEACRLVGVHPSAKMVDTTPVRALDVLYGRALSAMRYMKPHQVKFRRLTNLTLTLFKHHTLIPMRRFDKAVETLFEAYLTPREANLALLKMSEPQLQQLLKQAEELADTCLKRPWR